MKISVLVCNMDGTQYLEEREVADDWLPAEAPDPQETAADGAQ